MRTLGKTAVPCLLRLPLRLLLVARSPALGAGHVAVRMSSCHGRYPRARADSLLSHAGTLCPPHTVSVLICAGLYRRQLGGLEICARVVAARYAPPALISPPSSAIPPWLIRTRTTSQRPCCWSVSAPTAGEPSQLHGASGAGRRSPERKRGRRDRFVFRTSEGKWHRSKKTLDTFSHGSARAEWNAREEARPRAHGPYGTAARSRTPAEWCRAGFRVLRPF